MIVEQIKFHFGKANIHRFSFQKEKKENNNHQKISIMKTPVQQFFKSFFKDRKEKQVLVFNDLYRSYAETEKLPLSKERFKRQLIEYCNKKKRKISFSIAYFKNLKASLQVVIIDKPMQHISTSSLIADGLGLLTMCFAQKAFKEILDKPRKITAKKFVAKEETKEEK